MTKQINIQFNPGKKTIQEKFEQFDQDNPRVYELFVKYAAKALATGKMTSSKLIINRIRWDVYLETKDESSTFKINDAYSSRYVRKFLLQFPKYTGQFELRTLRTD